MSLTLILDGLRLAISAHVAKPFWNSVKESVNPQPRIETWYGQRIRFDVDERFLRKLGSDYDLPSASGPTVQLFMDRCIQEVTL